MVKVMVGLKRYMYFWKYLYFIFFLHLFYITGHLWYTPPPPPPPHNILQIWISFEYHSQDLNIRLQEKMEKGKI